MENGSNGAEMGRGELRKGWRRPKVCLKSIENRGPRQNTVAKKFNLMPDEKEGIRPWSVVT